MNNVPSPTPAELVESYITMRNEKKRIEDEFKQGEPMQKLEAQCLQLLNSMGVDSISGQSGTVYRKVNTSVTIADPSAFRRHVIGLEAWNLIDWRANKTAVNDLIDNGEPLPPGLNRTTFFDVGFRKKS
jgi:hypothetical protein